MPPTTTVYPGRLGYNMNTFPLEGERYQITTEYRRGNVVQGVRLDEAYDGGGQFREWKRSVLLSLGEKGLEGALKTVNEHYVMVHETNVAAMQARGKGMPEYMWMWEKMYGNAEKEEELEEEGSVAEVVREKGGGTDLRTPRTMKQSTPSVADKRGSVRLREAVERLKRVNEVRGSILTSPQAQETTDNARERDEKEAQEKAKKEKADREENNRMAHRYEGSVRAEVTRQRKRAFLFVYGRLKGKARRCVSDLVRDDSPDFGQNVNEIWDRLVQRYGKVSVEDVQDRLSALHAWRLRENEDYAPQFDELASLVDELAMKGHATSDITYETIITRALKDPLYTSEEMRNEWSTWLSTLSVSKKQHKWSFEKWWEEMQEKALDIDRIKERETGEGREGKGIEGACTGRQSCKS